MAQCRFSTPVLAHQPLAKGGPCRKALDGPREALLAIHKEGLGGFRFEAIELAQTVRKLARAVQEPTPEILEEAREALAGLVEASPEPRRLRPTPA
jgi:hypothetical protein